MAVDWQDVYSSDVQSVGYDSDSQELHVVWNSGRESVYEGVESDEFKKIITAPSVGKILRDEIKGVYPHHYA